MKLNILNGIAPLNILIKIKSFVDLIEELCQIFEELYFDFILVDWNYLLIFNVDELMNLLIEVIHLLFKFVIQIILADFSKLNDFFVPCSG